MNVSSFVFEQTLKQLGVPAAAIRQLQIAGRLSDIDGSGFPAELFQLSAPMVTRGDELCSGYGTRPEHTPRMTIGSTSM